jgi:hypothetical protein
VSSLLDQSQVTVMEQEEVNAEGVADELRNTEIEGIIRDLKS